MEDLPVLSLWEVGDFTLAESTILPLLCSVTHAMASVLKAAEEVGFQTSGLQASVANSLPNCINHLSQLNQIQSSLRDLSHRINHLPRALVVVLSQALSSHPRPPTAPAPPALHAKGAPSQPPTGPTPSFGAIVGGTSKFDEAAWENIAAKKNLRSKKGSTANTSVTKVAEASKKAPPPKATPGLPELQEDFAPLARPLNHTLMLPT